MSKPIPQKIAKIVSSERGISLIAVIFVTIFMTTISVVTLSLVVTDNRVTAHHLESARAFWLSEAGIERALLWLRYQDPPPGGISPFTLYNNVSIDGDAGTYSVVIDPVDDNANTYIKQYDILSTGNDGAISRQIQIRVQMTTFGKYIYLTGSEGSGRIWFTTGDVIEGPLHSNDQISIQGSPIFLGKVTSSYSSFYEGSPYDPTFKKGYQLGVPQVTFPTFQDVNDNYWAVNNDPPPLIIDARFSKHSSIQFNADGTITYNVWHWSGGNKIYDIHNATANLSDLNGAIFVQGDVQLKGTVNGQVTVVATDDINITDDLLYADANAQGEPNPGCDDVLGLISSKNIIVANTAANRDNVVIDAAILALGNSFTVEDYDSGYFRGTLTVWGSLSQKVRGPVGTFGGSGGGGRGGMGGGGMGGGGGGSSSQTGYLKDYHYDTRFESLVPPYYPTTGAYEVTSWKEIVL
ncbi:MAG: DUF4900 domain-containing protein [Calditrichaeota bacterium]|nr:DUF4900 domain-containing protein [Calditrichota bacterium]